MKTTITLLSILIFSSFTFGSSFVVNNNGDTSDANPSDNLCLDSNGNCTLRAAIEQANATAENDAISFTESITSIILSSQININNNGQLTINGRGANLLTITNPNNRIFQSNAATLTIRDLSVIGGRIQSFTTGSGAGMLVNGGATTLEFVVFNDNRDFNNRISAGNGGGVNFIGGNHVIRNSTFSNNVSSGNGGGIANNGGSVKISNSTFSGNIASFNSGGGIYNAGNLDLRNVTITNNTARSSCTSACSGQGGGLAHNNGTLTFGNTIISGNRTLEVGGPGRFQFEIVVFSGTFTSLGNNFIGDSPGDSIDTGNAINYQSSDILDRPPVLGALTINNGGTTPTHALLAGSPAIDKGNNALAVDAATGVPLIFDQRGVNFNRFVDGDGDGVATVDIGAFESQTAAPRTRFDFDGDGRADISVFRPSNGYWYQLHSRNNIFYALQFGQQGDRLAPADYDGDGRTDIAVFRDVVPGAGNFAYFYITNSSNNSFVPVQFGATGDVPVSGDWDADGKADLAVYRAAAAGGQSLFLYRPSSAPGVDFRAIAWGTAGDKPVVGDFDGDGRLDAAVFRPSIGQWYVLKSSDNQVINVQFGAATDIPTPADFDGDGITNIAVFRPSTGYWYTSLNPATNYGGVQFGAAEDLPVAADYDGDGRADVAVFRPSNGSWYLLRSTQGFTGVQFGLSEDKPSPNAFIR